MFHLTKLNHICDEACQTQAFFAEIGYRVILLLFICQALSGILTNLHKL